MADRTAFAAMPYIRQHSMPKWRDRIQRKTITAERTDIASPELGSRMEHLWRKTTCLNHLSINDGLAPDADDQSGGRAGPVIIPFGCMLKW
jgi:hypothetical protein